MHVCVIRCVWFDGRVGWGGVGGCLVAAIDDSKAAETGAVTGDAHPLIPPLQIGGEGDFQEVYYRHTHTHTKIALYTCMHPVNRRAMQCTHRVIEGECVCFGES